MSQRALPRDAKLITLLLATAGADDAEPGVVAMLLEFAHRWTSDVLQDAVIYREHAGSTSGVTGPPRVEDVKLAIQSRVEQQAKSTFPKDFLLSLANQLNAHQLPPIEGVFGPIKLPPERERLTAVNYDLAPRPPPQPRAQNDDMFGDEEMDEVKPNGHAGDGSDDDAAFEDVTTGLNPAALGRL